MGKNVYHSSMRYQQSTINLDLTSFQNGIYFIKATAIGGKVYTQKLIINR
ncbi:MAG: T9SS type A sorting domain-containing protein [Bacteroidota bacterium]